VLVLKIFISFFLSYGVSLKSVEDPQIKKIVKKLIKKHSKENKVVKYQVKEKNILIDVKYNKQICLRHHYKINNKGELHVLETLTSCM